MFSVYCIKIGGFCPKQAISMKRYFTRQWNTQHEINTNVIPAKAGISPHKLQPNQTSPHKIATPPETG